MGNQTRLIFHLSYDFKQSGHNSVNSYTPDWFCSVKYKDLDYVVRQSLKLLETLDDLNCPIWYSKADLKSAFRILCTSPQCWWLMIIMAISPVTKKKQYFVDKCLPFGHCISCTLFQKFSDALAHLLKFHIRHRAIENTVLTNYLDDFLFVALSRMLFNAMMMEFLQLCKVIGVPVSEEKTEWTSFSGHFVGWEITPVGSPG